MPETIAPVMEIIDRACGLNAAVDLHLRTMRDELYVARARMIRYDEQFLYFDQPQIIGENIRFGKDQRFQVYLNLDDKIYAFESQITDGNCVLELNEMMEVKGITMSLPTRVREGQRRQDYRVSLASVDDVCVHIHEADPTDLTACSRKAKRCEGFISNMSFGGMKIRVDRCHRHMFRVDRLYFVGFTVPDDSQEFRMLVKLRHEVTVESLDMTLLGTKFIEWPGARLHEQAQRIHKFCMDVQRRTMVERP